MGNILLSQGGGLHFPLLSFMSPLLQFPFLQFNFPLLQFPGFSFGGGGSMSGARLSSYSIIIISLLIPSSFGTDESYTPLLCSRAYSTGVPGKFYHRHGHFLGNYNSWMEWVGH